MKTLVLILVATQVALAAAQDRLNLEPVKPLDASGSYIHLIGNSLFLTPGKGFGRIKSSDDATGGWFDIGADAAAPKLICQPLPAAWDIVMVGDYAITCNYLKFITVYDTKERPWREVAKLDLPSMAENIVLRGHHAYVADHTAGLVIVDVSTPTQPRIVSQLDPHIDCDAVAFWQNSAVLYGHHEGQIVLADISDPAKPRQTGVCQLPKILNGGELEVEKGFAYVTSKKGLFVVSVTDAANPRLVTEVNLGGVAHDVIVQDDLVFVAAGDRGVRVLDARNPRQPVEIGYYQPGADFVASALAVKKTGAGYYLYAANLAGRAMVLRFQPPANTNP